MKISRLKFKNVYGITERELEPGDVTIIEGGNGLGKTSILDAIATTLSNKGLRPQVINKSAEEAQLLIEMDDELIIDRKKRMSTSDYTKVTRSGNPVPKPQGYLDELFNTNQINPLEFIDMRDRDQAKLLLKMTPIPFASSDYEKAFGFIPEDYDSEAHVLVNLDRFVSKKGTWWKLREEENRKELFKRQSIKEEQSKLPENYDPEKWRNVSLSKIYEDINKIKAANEDIAKCQRYVEDSKYKIDSVKHMYTQKKDDATVKSLLETDRLKENRAKNIEEIEKLKQVIAGLEKENEQTDTLIQQECGRLEEKKKHYNELQSKELEVIEDNVKKSQDYIDSHKVESTEELAEKASNAEKMKEYIQLWDAIEDMKIERQEHEDRAGYYDDLIVKARKLPGELLEKAKMPIEGMSINNGELLINELPIGNLSDGEKLTLAMEVAKYQTGELKIVLADGLEKLSKGPREKFLKAAKESGIQFFITHVTDNDEELNIIQM